MCKYVLVSYFDNYLKKEVVTILSTSMKNRKEAIEETYKSGFNFKSLHDNYSSALRFAKKSGKDLVR